MRLFIAINFEEIIKQRLLDLQKTIASQSISGRWIRYDNLHLTLCFIGEVNSSYKDKIIEILNGIKHKAFDIEISHIGEFRNRNNGDIVWIGIKENPLLQALGQELTKALNNIGLSIDNRPYLPHITLGRQVVRAERYKIKNTTLSTKVKKLDLMLSERKNGKLIYSILYSKDLN